mgnify:CR=1 FL=1
MHSARNFYGALSVKEVEIDGKMERRLIDGTTSHGTQFVEPTEQHIPLSYYRANTGVALAFEVLAANNINAGFIGLGAGALAAYGRKQDTFTFYELNPAVKAAAETYFTYLSDSKANVDIRLGDGRVSLQNALDSQQEHDFNLLVVDAFSGDSIPQHLLTIEALSLYLAHLADDGIIAFHISNTHLDLRPLVLGLAQSENLLVAYFKTDGKHSGEHDTEWMWLTRDKNVLTHPKVKHLGLRMMANGSEVTWNDDFSPLISILK